MIFELDLLSSKKTLRQFCSYVLIGVLINILGYALYLFLTYLSGAPKLTMTALYFLGASIGFFANRRFTFLHDGHIGAIAARYVLAQFIGYVLNLLLLVFFVDWLKFPHQIIQAIAIVTVAIFLFAVMRIFVFPPNLTATGFVRL
jgi:putative flippase GtrA